MPARRSAGAALLFAAVLAGCASSSDAPNDGAICAAYRAERSDVEVVAAGTVTRVLGVAPGRVSPHEGFLLRLNSGCDLVVRVETNTAFTGTFALQRGDRAIVKGVYEYYARGGVLHWTHRDPRFHHVAGFVQTGGNRYQ